MHQLHLALDEDPTLREYVYSLSDRIGRNPLKHGMVLDLNPFWDAAQRLEAAGLVVPHWHYWLREGGSPIVFPIPRTSGVIDLQQRYDIADYLTEEYFGRDAYGPYMLRILAAPSRSAGDAEWRQQLVSAAREAKLPTIVDTVERAQLIATPGDRLTCAGSSGTLGGFLRDGSYGATYAVTCGHVVSAGSVSTKAGTLGNCVYATPPKALSSGTVCDANCSQMAKLDVALIDVGTATVSNVATTTCSLVSKGDLVEMRGATSGTVTYEVGGAVVEIEIGGSCWNRLYQLHAPTAGILPFSVSVATTPMPQPGDSGAWVLRNKTEWAGMVVAADPVLTGYALSASEIVKHSNANFSVNLQLI
ncbi:hypothetical protein [Asticcacaulis biprosthecium]|uniref:hypothetical protein n=1 Tax=Asticcacaulis biprosthecium TaxID=76891 RepID=UPI0002DAC8CA|nr:hypothetical protein [Asticcacaulis biprosthecium]